MFACMLMPGLLLCVYIVYRLQRTKAEDVRRHQDRFIKLALTVIFLVFPFVGQTMFAVRCCVANVVQVCLTNHCCVQGFGCFKLADKEEWLAADMQISCFSTEYYAFVFFGTIGVLAYPIGVPALTLLMLLKNGQEIRQRGPIYSRYEFLVNDCESRLIRTSSSFQLYARALTLPAVG